MSINRKSRKPIIRYDWHPFREVCMRNPMEWFCEDDPDRPKTSPFLIRRGSPLIFRPNGAFDSVTRKSEGLFIRYVGVPVEWWPAWDERDFHDVIRTFDPALFPPVDLPDDFRAMAEALTPEEFRRLPPRSLREADAETEAEDGAAGATEA